MSDLVAQIRLRLRPSYLLGDSPVAKWLRGAGWLFTSSLIERAASLVQTVIIARAIGIDDYGRYALLYSTISLLTPLIGLQLPYAIIYFVSRFQTKDPARAGAVVLLGKRLTMVTTGALLVVVLLFTAPLSRWLYNADGYGLVVVLGAINLLASVQAGLSDTLLQASEKFRVLAIARLSTAILSVAVLVPVAIMTSGLIPVLMVVVGAALYRWAAVGIPARKITAALVAQTSFREALRQGSVILHFSLPSGLLALAQGIAAWSGNYYISRSPAGLRDLAIMNTGLQWRSPILVVMASLASALLPMLGRYLGEDNKAQTHRLQRYNMILNVGISLGFCFVVILCSNWILALYGHDFRGQWYVFALFLIALVPTVYCNVHQQYLVATGRMWTQVSLFIPYTIILVAGTTWFAQGLRGATLGYIQLAGWMVTAVLITAVVAIDRHRDRVNEAEKQA